MDAGRDLRSLLDDLLHRLDHVLPAQAPIRDFVHHNTLHGFQHLPFREALAAAEAATGARGYLPLDRFRDLFRQGRIDLTDLNGALDETPELGSSAPVAGQVNRRQVLLAALLADCATLPAATWLWRVEELGVLERVDPGVPPAMRERLLRDGDEAQALDRLWRVCVEMQASSATEPPDAPVTPVPPGREGEELWQRHVIRKEAERRLAELLAHVPVRLTLRGLLTRLTGRDVLDEIRPYLIRHLSAHLDQGVAAWPNPTRARGFYAAWLDSARQDPHFDLHGLVTWGQTLERLPEEPLDAILQALLHLGLEPEDWRPYLESLAKELPGWSGMVLWRDRHPGYGGLGVAVATADYLAVRLVLEQVHAQRLCALHFKSEASLPGLRGYLRRHPAELLVRLALYGDDLPEWLADQGHRLVRAATDRTTEEWEAHWRPVAGLLDAWRRGGHAETPAEQAATERHAWPLFLLCQHLGLPAADLSDLEVEGARALLACLAELTPERASWVWLQAYERHYREEVFAALAANHGRGPWRERATPPQAQLVFCMDDREEGFRRHLEECNPNIETLGAAAHFSVFIRYTPLGDEAPMDLCPVGARPSHAVREAPTPDAQSAAGSLLRAHARRRAWKDRLIQGGRRDPGRGLLATLAGAPGALAMLAVKMLAPAAGGKLDRALGCPLGGAVPTRLDYTAATAAPSDPEAPRPGFTDAEQADRVQALLRNIGLTSGFAPLVVIAGHGSNSQNNPHMSAYDCGACSGRHSGPNARLLAAMANRSAVRALLRERSIGIPPGTWFLGCEHNTCDDLVTWYDSELLPASHVTRLQQLDATLKQAGALHAQERSRRFMSASLGMDPDQARRHVVGRRHDYSQARPELGHATNASAFIGRRAATRGAFFDRRMFLVSYDCAEDPEGEVLEPLLLANGPVGAGISLEYYFSTVDNERYGCGTKVTHNIAGLLGVMEGAASDLRTGLPRQMIEIHEAMRLLIVVEHSLDVLTAIYRRQPPLQELIGNGWVQLAAKDPESAAIHRFVPGMGWVEWQGPEATLPRVMYSSDWVRGQREALPPVLIEMAVGGAA